MERLLSRIHQTGELQIEKPLNAAEHFFCLIKGAPNFRRLYGYGEPLSAEAGEAHIRDVVGMFMRAYRPV